MKIKNSNTKLYITLTLSVIASIVIALSSLLVFLSRNEETASADSSLPVIEYTDSISFSAQPPLFSSSYFYKLKYSGSIERELFPPLTTVSARTDIPSGTYILFNYVVEEGGVPAHTKIFEPTAYYFGSPSPGFFIFEFYMGSQYILFTFNTSNYEFTLSSNWVDTADSLSSLYFSYIYSSYQSWGPNAQSVPYLLTLLSTSNLYDTGLNDAPYTSEDLQNSYDSGVSYGYALGYSNGSSTAPAYQKGFEAGVKVGQSQSGDGNASLLGLISAVVDAPIQAFSGLMNFKIFDIDLAPFLLSLFTVCIIISVVRIFI